MNLLSSNWRKSSYSGTESDCVEVAFGAGCAAIRDSKDPEGGVLVLRPGTFAALVVQAGAQGGEPLPQ